MNEFKLIVEAPALTEAIKALATALGQIGAPVADSKPEKKKSAKTAPVAETVQQEQAPATIPAPVSAPAPAAVPVQAPNPAPAAVPTAVPAPVQPQVNTPVTPASVMPQAATAPAPYAQQPKTYTLEEIGRAGSVLLEQGKMNELQSLLMAFGVQSINQLAPDQLPAFAASLRGIGAAI